MFHSILSFALAGLLGGLLAGLLDALTVTGGSLAMCLAADMGLHGSLSLALGALVGALHPLVPVRLRGRSLLRELRGRLWPRRDDALTPRCRTVATLWAGIGAIYGGVLLLSTLNTLLMGRVQSAHFAAMSVALAGVAITGVAVAVATPIAAGLSRTLETLIRRFPSLTPISHPTVSLTLTALSGLAWLLVWAAARDTALATLDIRPVLSAAVIALAIFVGGDILLDRWRHWRLRAVTGVTVGLAACAVGALLGGLQDPETPRALSSTGGTSRLALNALRAPFDADEDGFATVLGGGDCDDTNPTIYPGALEVPGNGLDEDCDGVDSQAPSPPEQAPPPTTVAGLRPPYNLVLITVSSLRADHVGAYGYARDTTPALDALASEGAVFRHAFSASSKLPTALPALLTGRYPSELVRDDRHYTTYSAANTFIAELLRPRGYRTAAFPAHWYFDRRYGLAQGFERWQPTTPPEATLDTTATSAPTVQAALAYLETLKPDPSRPFFLWVHLHDPAQSYLTHPDVLSFGEQPIDRYDHEIRYTDAWIGALLDALESRSDWNRTAIIATGAHGEAFGEHGYNFHGQGLHEHQLHVPLIIRVPQLPHRVITTAVTHLDLVRTMLDLAGVPPDAPARMAMKAHGQSLAPMLLGRAQPNTPIYAEMPAGPNNPSLVSLRLGAWKLHRNITLTRDRLFNLSGDPLEQIDVLRRYPEKATELRAALKLFQDSLSSRRATP